LAPCKHLLDFTVIVFALEMISENNKTNSVTGTGRARRPDPLRPHPLRSGTVGPAEAHRPQAAELPGAVPPPGPRPWRACHARALAPCAFIGRPPSRLCPRSRRPASPLLMHRRQARHWTHGDRAGRAPPLSIPRARRSPEQANAFRSFTTPSRTPSTPSRRQRNAGPLPPVQTRATGRLLRHRPDSVYVLPSSPAVSSSLSSASSVLPPVPPN
jgi:hypothetical protein